MKHFSLSLALLILVAGMSFPACDMARLGVKAQVNAIPRVSPAFDRETNLHLAEMAAYGSLKQLEAFMEIAPDLPKIYFYAAKSFCSVASGFIEMKTDSCTDPDNETCQKWNDTAIDFFERGRNYAAKYVTMKFDKGFSAALKGPVKEIRARIAKMGKEAVPGLFWTALCWSGAIRFQLDNMAKLIELPKPKAIMDRVVQLDENYFHAGPHLFFGAVNALKPKAMGGRPDLSLKHFDRAWQLVGGRILTAKFYKARFYAVSVQDKALFVRLLKEILAAPRDLNTKHRLVNVLMKARAKLWLKRTEDLF